MNNLESAVNSNEFLLLQLYKNVGCCKTKFLDTVFDFFLKQDLDKVDVSAEHLIHQCYSRAKLKYLEIENSKSSDFRSNDNVPFPSNEVEISDNVEIASNKCLDSKISEKVIIPNKGRISKFPDFDTTNGAVYDNYAWTQTVEDIEVRIAVPSYIQKGKQIKATIESCTIKFEIITSEGKNETLINGEFLHPIKSEESIWSLHPGQHLLVNLEKSKDCSWDRLLKSESPIDLKHIYSERDFSTLPEAEQSKIQEIMWNHKQKQLGKPTSDETKMDAILRKAWNAEGSPFKGQDYDPSILNIASNIPP